MENEFKEYTYLDLIGEIQHLAQIDAFADSKRIPYNTNDLNHSRMEQEVINLTKSVNSAIDTFFAYIAPRKKALMEELMARKYNL